MAVDVKSTSPTPMLDELEKGPWPSFVSCIKEAGKTKAMARDLLLQLEQSYRDGVTHWKHGGIVGVLGYGGGVIGRYSDSPDKFPGVAHFHTVRVNQPAGKFYTTKALRQIFDIWNRRGSGLTNFHGSTGDMVFLGTTTDELEPIFAELTKLGWDLGGSGSCLRTPSDCVGMSRCEFACIDCGDFTNDVTHTYQDELHRPMWPYKTKIKVAGCPNDCIGAIARADCSVIGTWRDDIQVNPDAVAECSKTIDIQAEVVGLCPTSCMRWDGKKLSINNKECSRCMHCINVMPRALKPGKDRGATICIGAKAPILMGAQLSSVVIPFMRMESPYEEFKDFIAKAWEWWDENGKNRERIGELILRKGMKEFLDAVGLKADPRMVKEPRSNPYVFWAEDEVPGGWPKN
ncbi:MAG: dissimilatory-type sulfite reductase subunit alpha [Pseudomonadota bacterium]